MTVSAHDAAAEIRRRLGRDVGVVKLHKLLYYAQGWSLAWVGEPLFEEKIHAWANGPVVAELWADETHDRPHPSERPLSGRQIAILDYVILEYGHYTGKALIRQTHLEDPWRDVSEDDDDAIADIGRSPEIGLEALSRWFTNHDDHQAHLAEVERLRAKSTDPFGPLEETPEFAAAIRRAVG